MWQFHPSSPILALNALALFGCAAFIQRRRPHMRGAVALTIASLAIGLHALGYALELSSTTLSHKLFWLDVQMLGIAAVPVCAVTFASMYAGRSLRPSTVAALSVVPAIAVLLTWSSPWHQALLLDTHLVVEDGLVRRHSGSGWAWWVFLLYTYTCLLATGTLYASAAMSGPPLQRRQARWLLLGLLVPFAANLVFHFVGTLTVDLTPFMYGISVMTWTWALARHHLLELAPVAHEVVLAMMDEGVLVLDERGRVLDANRAAAAMLSQPRDALVGRTPRELVSGEHQALRDALESHVRGMQEAGSVEIEFGDRFLTVDTRPITTERHARGCVVVLRDTTARREMEDAREAALAGAREATRLRSELLARTSHEVRTPLHGVLGSAELLAETQLDAAQRRWLDAIRSAGSSLLAIVDGILDLEQVRAGALRPRQQVFALLPTVESLLALFEGPARKRALTLRLVHDGALPEHVIGDERRLRQMLSNLVGNAVKFSREGEVTVTVTAHAERVSFVVRDHGPGIDAGTMSHLFEPFRQGDGSATRAHGGSGLGLAVTRELAQALGGRVDITVEDGTIATLELPLPASPAGVSPHAEPLARGSRARTTPSTASSRPTRVLVVEDHPVNAEIARAALEAEGCVVVHAARASEALSRLATERFDLVFMDLHMPDVSGIEATQSLRAAERVSGRPRTPVVAVSADVLGSHREEAAAAGVDGHMPKPFDREAVRAVLETHTRWRRGAELPGARHDTARQLYAATVPADLEAIRAARGDRATLRRLTHSLHGASLLLGLSGVADECAALLDLTDETPAEETIERLALAVDASLEQPPSARTA